MIEQQGRVIECGDGRATVRLGGQSGCPACDAGRGCGAGIFGRLLRRNPVDVAVADPFGVRPGDNVNVGISDRLFLAATAWLFILPLFMGLAGALLAMFLLPDGVSAGWRDGATALGAIVFAALAWVIAHARLPRQLEGLDIEMTTSAARMLDCRPIDHH